MMTVAEKLEKRLAQFPGRLVHLVVLVDGNGRIVAWVIEEKREIEQVDVVKTQPP